MKRLGIRLATAVFISVNTLAVAGGQPARAAIAPCSVQWGLYVDGIPWDPTMTAVRNLDIAVGRHSSIIHWYAQWGDYGSGNFAANQPWMLKAVHTYSSVGVSGSTPLITWEAWSGGSASNNPFPLTEIAAGKFDSYVDSWAVGLKGFGSTVMLDWGHEMDGNWYPWGFGVNGNTPDQYIAAFRHIHDRFVAAGASNVQFVWNPDVWNPSGIDQRSFYPGDGYVDWMAIDTYNWGANGGGWASLLSGLTVLTHTYQNVAGLSSKPMMLAEWASAEAVAGDPPGVTKAQWIIDAANAIGSQLTRLKAVVWFSTAGTFALNSSAGSIAAAAQGFGGCGSTPPPPPPPTAPPTAPPSAPPTAAPSPTHTPTPHATATPTRTPAPPTTPRSGGGSTPAPAHSAPATSSPKPGGGSQPTQAPSGPKAKPSPSSVAGQPSTSPVAAILAAFRTDEPGVGVLKMGFLLIALAFLIWAGSRLFFFVKRSGPRDSR